MVFNDPEQLKSYITSANNDWVHLRHALNGLAKMARSDVKIIGS